MIPSPPSLVTSENRSFFFNRDGVPLAQTLQRVNPRCWVTHAPFSLLSLSPFRLSFLPPFLPLPGLLPPSSPPHPSRRLGHLSQNPERIAGPDWTCACAGAVPAPPPVGSSSSEPPAASRAAPPRRRPARRLLFRDRGHRLRKCKIGVGVLRSGAGRPREGGPRVPARRAPASVCPAEGDPGRCLLGAPRSPPRAPASSAPRSPGPEPATPPGPAASRAGPRAGGSPRTAVCSLRLLGASGCKAPAPSSAAPGFPGGGLARELGL